MEEGYSALMLETLRLENCLFSPCAKPRGIPSFRIPATDTKKLPKGCLICGSYELS